jgi:hypothetical protein
MENAIEDNKTSDTTVFETSLTFIEKGEKEEVLQDKYISSFIQRQS